VPQGAIGVNYLIANRSTLALMSNAATITKHGFIEVGADSR
jgi:hypothetical protein